MQPLHTLTFSSVHRTPVPALFGACGGHGCIVNDPRGAVFQTVKTFNDEGTGTELAMDSNGVYKRNVVSNMQIIVAHAIMNGDLPAIPERQTGPNSIDQSIVEWAKYGTSLNGAYVCNGDSMHHGTSEPRTV